MSASIDAMPPRPTRRTAVFTGALACACAGLALAWAAGGQLPEMRSPIRITDARLGADGGSAAQGTLAALHEAFLARSH